MRIIETKVICNYCQSRHFITHYEAWNVTGAVITDDYNCYCSWSCFMLAEFKPEPIPRYYEAQGKLPSVWTAI